MLTEWWVGAHFVARGPLEFVDSLYSLRINFRENLEKRLRAAFLAESFPEKGAQGAVLALWSLAATIHFDCLLRTGRSVTRNIVLSEVDDAVHIGSAKVRPGTLGDLQHEDTTKCRGGMCQDGW